MAEHESRGELDPRFSSDDAVPTPWAEARRILKQAQVYWLSTERKALNLARNPQCATTTGCNVLEGVDVVVEGVAVRVGDEVTLLRLADAYASKYDDLFGFTVDEGRFHGPDRDEEVLVFEVAPTQAFAFGKGATFGQTRWRFRLSPAYGVGDE